MAGARFLNRPLEPDKNSATKTGPMQSFKNFYQKRFDASYGDGTYDIDSLMKKSVFRDWMAGHKSFKYLEAGSGKGRFPRELIARLQEKGCTASEVCFSDMENHLAPESARMGRFEACQLGDEPLPFPDHAFDLVVCNHVLEHVFQTENALRELGRVTAPGGLILLGVPNIGNWYSRFMFLFGFMPLGLECGTESVTYGKGLGKEKAKDFPPSGHIRGFTAKALREICEHCGLEVLSWWNQGIEPQSKLLYRYLGAIVRPR
jgi:SAM-dependent methyltransferase